MNKKNIILVIILIATASIFIFIKQRPKIPAVKQPDLPDFSELPEVPEAVKQEAREKLLHIKVATQYRYVPDGGVIGRSLDDTIKIISDTKADFIFQGLFVQQSLPDKCSDLSATERKKCEITGYSYENFKNAVSKTKQAMPQTIFGGGTLVEFFYPSEVPGASEEEQRDKAWEISLDPAKWGLNMTRRDVQCYWAKKWAMVAKNEQCPSEEKLKTSMRYYFPDITNPDFQKYFLNRIFKQIDAGVDAMWIDMLYVQPAGLESLAKDENHPAVKESYKAAWDIIDKIHRYGYSKTGKYIYVVTWVIRGDDNRIVIVPETNADIAMLSPAADEIKNKDTGKIGQFDEKLWGDISKQIQERLDLPIFVRIDYGGGRTPLGVFSQELTKNEAGEFLKKADDYFTNKGMTFIYPVHGGDMAPYGGDAPKLSYGKFNWYDSLAPEFDTYDIIKELTGKKTIN